MRSDHTGTKEGYSDTQGRIEDGDGSEATRQGAISVQYQPNIWATSMQRRVGTIPQTVPITHTAERKEGAEIVLPVPTMEVREVDGTILVESRFFSRLTICRHVTMQAEIGNFDPSIARFVEL